MLHPFEEKWRLRFERFAAKPTDAGIAGWSERGLDARVAFFQRTIKLEGKGRWGDIGCGAGTYTRLLKQQGQDVVGVDYSWPSLVKAKGQALLPWVGGNAYHLPFLSSAFDGILCFGVLQVLSQEGEVIKELNRVLKTKGELWIDGLNIFCPWHFTDILRRYFQKRPLHLRYVNPYAIKASLKTYGFTDLKLYWMPILPKYLTRLQWVFLLSGVQKIMNGLPWVSMWFSHAFYLHARKRNNEMV